MKSFVQIMVALALVFSSLNAAQAASKKTDEHGAMCAKPAGKDAKKACCDKHKNGKAGEMCAKDAHHKDKMACCKKGGDKAMCAKPADKKACCAKAKNGGICKHQDKMALWQKSLQLAPEHAKLASIAGEWTYTVSWRESKDAKPEVSKGQSTNRLINGKRFLQQKATSHSNGMLFEGMGLTGYDNITKQFQSVWTDNMSSSMMIANGEWNAEKTAIVESGTLSCPVTGKSKKFDATWTFVNKNKYTYSMSAKDDKGRYYQVMEIVYTRK